VTSLAPSVPIRLAGHDTAMSESDPTGYGESPDTSDGPVADDQTDDQTGDQTGDQAQSGDVTLTTDDDAQKDDGIVRPGNEPD
jgi:hypothetical protein